MPPGKYWLHELRRELSRGERAIWRATARHFDIPHMRDVESRLPVPFARRLELRFRRRPTADSVWGVSMVRDEVDVVAYTIEHLLAQGLDHIIVADNMSTDGTYELLRELATTLPVTVVRDRLPAFHQAHKVTRLARLAVAGGAEWIVPFDADELWVAQSGRLVDVLRASSESVLDAPMFDHVPSTADDLSEPNPYLRINQRCVDPLVMGKVAFRAHRLAYVAAGNHAVQLPDSPLHRKVAEHSPLSIRHVPYRNPAQVARKVYQGTEAVRHDGVPQTTSIHWQALSTRDLEQIVEHYLRLDRDIVFDPAPFTALPDKVASLPIVAAAVSDAAANTSDTPAQIARKTA